MHIGSKAVLQVLAGIGWRLTAGVLGLPPISWLVALCYRVFAGNRRFFAKFVFWPAHPDVKDF